MIERFVIEFSMPLPIISSAIHAMQFKMDAFVPTCPLDITVYRTIYV